MGIAVEGAPPAAPYRGEDRRRTATAVEPPIGRPYLAAVWLVGLWWLVLTFFMPLTTQGPVRLPVVVNMLHAGAGLMALTVACLAIARWRLAGDAPALWIGVAGLVSALLRYGLVELWPSASPDGLAPVIAYHARPAVMMVHLMLIVGAVVVSPVDARWSAPRLLSFAVATAAVLGGLLAAMPELHAVVGVLTGQASGGEVGTLGLIPFVWVAAGFLITRKGRRAGRWLWTWFGLLLFSMALAEFTRVLTTPPAEIGLFARDSLRLLGLTLAAYGATRELLYTHRDVSVRLARSEFNHHSARLAAEERAHEARSALAAIEGATRTLEHYKDRLPPETRESLTLAVSVEIRRLQRLVSVEEAPADRTAFGIAHTLLPLVITERARGTTISATISADLQAFGRPGSTAEVVQTLLDNARRYAPDAPIDVDALVEGDRVVVRVGDRGPGVAPEQREAIFRRGVRGEAATDGDGSGLGLYLADKLMREQGGQLWVDGRPGGGASFALALPAAPSAVGGETLQDLQDAGHVGQRHTLATALRRH